MPTIGRGTLTLGMLCLLVFLAGCGEDKANDFRSGYNKIVRRNASLPTEIGAAVRGASAKSDAALARQFSDLADRVSRESEDMDKLDPPDDAKDEFDAFVTGLATVGKDLQDISDAAKAHSTRKARDGANALVKDSDRLSKREDALKKAVD